MFCLEEILSLGKARDKILLSDHLLKLRKEKRYPSLVSLYGKIVPPRIRFIKQWHPSPVSLYK